MIPCRSCFGLSLWCHALSFYLDLYRSRMSFDDVGTSFDTLLSVADDWSVLRGNTSALVELYDLIYYYASIVYKKTKMKAWLKANRHLSVLDKMKASDLAFSLLVFENYHPKWVAEIKVAREQEGMKHDDHQGADTRVTDKEAAEDLSSKKKRIARMKLRYTKDPFAKKKYLESGWTPEGLKRYEELQKLFAGLLRNKVAWQACKDGWDSYIEGKRRDDVIVCWVPKYHSQDLDGTSDDGNDSGEEEGFDFVLEGSEGGGKGELSDVVTPDLPPMVGSALGV